MSSLATTEAQVLDERDVSALLARNITGRIAFELDGEIEILPVSYVYADDTIYLRSSGTGRLAGTDPAGARVAFEVDEIHSTNKWRSVVVRGTLLRIDREGQHEEWMRAVGRLRRLMPDALRETDFAGYRNTLFRILVRNASGRAMG
jgi:nitroimidazol reductase NimA-like FMN-containing flavoprotein (pyridoxamine 5'-phosphate oxidase superfamily)